MLATRDRVDPAVAILTLNRPAAANAISLELANRLLAATLDIAPDRSVRAVILRGEGPAFCGGGDLKSFVTVTDMARHLQAVAVPLHGAIQTLNALNAPVVSAVHGFAAGAGLSLACVADVVLASEDARFHFAYGAVGLSPDGGASWLLPRLIGTRRTLMLALRNRALSAQEALDWGLISDIEPADRLQDAALELARSLARAPTAALGRTKRLIWSSLEHSMADQMDAEVAALVASGSSSDGVEGVRAFVDKRAPEFTGS